MQARKSKQRSLFRKRLVAAVVRSFVIGVALLSFLGYRAISSDIVDDVALSPFSSSRRLLDDDDGPVCSDVRKLKDADHQCHWVRNHCDDVAGVFNYLEWRYCEGRHYPAIVIIVMFVWMLVLFLLLGTTADQFFTGSLERICEALKLSPNVAGVTFLALGNGAPDISSIIVGTVQGSSGIGIGEPIGSGCFVTMIVMALVTLGSSVRVTRRPFIRDVAFYIIALSYVIIVTADEEITLAEACIFVVIYMIYVAVVVVGRKIFQARKKRGLERQGKILEAQALAHEDAPLSKERSLSRARGGSHAHHFGHAQLAFITEGLQYDQMALLKQVPADDTAPRDITMSIPPTAEAGAASTAYTKFDDNAPLAANASSSHDVVVEQMEEEKDEEPTLKIEDIDSFEAFCAWFVQEIEWKDKNLFEKCIFPFIAPFLLMMNGSTPKVEEWRRGWTSIAVVGSPVVLLLVVGYFTFLVGNAFPLAILLYVCCAPIGFAVWKFTSTDKEPRGMLAVVFHCFLMSVCWIYLYANEVVVVLQSFGVMFDIDDSIMALTVLAWANSLGDCVSNLLVSRQGFPQMAVGAIYASPMLNLLIGVGTATIISTSIHYPKAFKVKEETTLKIGFIFLMLSLCSSVIIVPLSKFKSPRFFGFILIIFYVLFMILGILASVDVIKF
jgi:sodium/potassium/calcium exchanger 6